MPHPINYHVADCVVRVILNHFGLSPEQEDNIHTFIRSMPVRIVIDLLSHTHREFVTIPLEDSMEVDRILSSYYTPYREQFQIILNEIRIIYGEPSWYPEGSYLRNTSLNALRLMREIEENDGIDPEARSRLYQMVSDITDDIVNHNYIIDNNDNENENHDNNYDSDDDNTSIASGSTAITEPLENNLNELLDVQPPLEMIF